MAKFVCLLFLGFVAIGCSSIQQRQGIKGQVLWVSGNQMPGPGTNRTAQIGIQRDLYVYELTSTRQATLLDNGLYADVQTRLVAKITTKGDGSFKLKLPPGQYSVFVKEEAGLFANLFDQNNSINPITVKEKEYTRMPIIVNYQASY